MLFIRTGITGCAALHLQRSAALRALLCTSAPEVDAFSETIIENLSRTHHTTMTLLSRMDVFTRHQALLPVVEVNVEGKSMRGVGSGSLASTSLAQKAKHSLAPAGQADLRLRRTYDCRNRSITCDCPALGSLPAITTSAELR